VPGRMMTEMDDLPGFLLWACAGVILLVVGFVALRALGPADWSLFRARRDGSSAWPRGVQEEEPARWHFDVGGPAVPPPAEGPASDGSGPDDRGTTA
jgi:hypothetical protein